VALAWQRLRFISKVPLVQSGICVEEEAEEAAPRLQQSAMGATSGEGEEASDVLASRDSGLFKLCLGE
jgi:hypothetical protein